MEYQGESDTSKEGVRDPWEIEKSWPDSPRQTKKKKRERKGESPRGLFPGGKDQAEKACGRLMGSGGGKDQNVLSRPCPKSQRLRRPREKKTVFRPKPKPLKPGERIVNNLGSRGVVSIVYENTRTTPVRTCQVKGNPARLSEWANLRLKGRPNTSVAGQGR